MSSKEGNVEVSSSAPTTTKKSTKEPFYLRTIPELPRGLAIMIFLCNLFFPSSGTFFMACIGDKLRKTQFIIAILQFITTFILVGFFWSIAWGIIALKKSYKTKEYLDKTGLTAN